MGAYDRKPLLEYIQEKILHDHVQDTTVSTNQPVTAIPEPKTVGVEFSQQESKVTIAEKVH